MFTIKRVLAVLAVALSLMLGTTILASAALAATCSTAWGSGAKTAALQSQSPLVQVRAGPQPCYDRVVFQVAGSTGTGYSVRYVSTVYSEGQGLALTVPGDARLQVVLHHPAYDEYGTATFEHRVGSSVANLAGFTTLRSVIYGGSFEGQTTFGVGVRARLPFRVFTVAGPGGDSRIVFDVAHRWS